jgi:hypothetical protein
MRGGHPLPDWDKISLSGRKIRIVFDSDISTNSHVRKAALRLAEFLITREASPAILELPSPDGTKFGIDDYLVSGGKLTDIPLLDEHSEAVWQAAALVRNRFSGKRDSAARAVGEYLLDRMTAERASFTNVSQRSMAKRLDISKRAVTLAVEKLRQSEIFVHGKTADFTGRPKHFRRVAGYKLNLPLLEREGPSAPEYMYRAEGDWVPSFKGRIRMLEGTDPYRGG